MRPRLEGFGFPFRVENGGVRRSNGFAKVEEDVRHLIATRLGERAMLRTYGGGVHQRLQEVSDPTLAALVRYEVEQALRLHLPDVRVIGGVGVEARESTLEVSFDYVASPDDLVRRVELTV